MKILITSDWYTPAVNGVVTSVLNLKSGLEARGHEVRVLTLSNSIHSFREGDVTRIGSLSAGKIYPGARIRSAMATRLVHDLMEWRPDVIHSQCEFSTFFMAKKIAHRLQVPLVHTYHTVYEDYTHYFCPSRRVGRKAVSVFSDWVSARVSCMIVPTEKVKTLLESYHVQSPVRVIPTGIALDRFSAGDAPEKRQALRRELGVPADHLALVSVCRLAEEKNVGEIISALAACRDLPVSLVLVGDGPCRAELEAQVGSLDLSGRVRFVGMVPPTDVARYYRAGDLFVCASTSETQGLTYIEALASGVPVLCRRDPCVAGVVRSGENGWQYDTAEEFCSYLRTFCSDPDLRDSLAHGALESARRFSVAAFAEAAEDVYRKCIDRY
jgi:1,2-diacylglycerol 3-alpha-glucosyltransferase